MSSAVVANFHWDVPPSALVRAIEDYGQRVQQAIFALAQWFAAKLEAYAKQQAPWTDRTGNARQGLTGLAVQAATGAVLYLIHQVSYGVHLELAHAGQYAIITKTLEAHYGELSAALDKLVKR